MKKSKIATLLIDIAADYQKREKFLINKEMIMNEYNLSFEEKNYLKSKDISAIKTLLSKEMNKDAKIPPCFAQAIFKVDDTDSSAKENKKIQSVILNIR